MKINFVIKVKNHLSLKYVGADEEKALKERSTKEEAEAHAYRLPNGNLAIPNSHVCGCLRDYLISHAGDKKKKITEEQVRPRLRIEPVMLDTGIKDYTIDSRLVLVKKSGRIASIIRCSRPLIPECKISGTLVTTLDRTIEDLHRDLNGALQEIGMGSDRIEGYGRGEVISFLEEKGVTP